MNLNKQFLGSSNLEFVLDPDSGNISKKILYRSYGDSREYRKNILNFLRASVLSPENIEKIEAIFCIPETQNLVFHFGEDESSGRIKFYISLYSVPYKISLLILSQIKKIIGEEKYFLEANFQAFDCIGLDISKKGIRLKVYELVLFHDIYYSFLPEYVERKNIKEVGFLKSIGRKKIFFRLQNHLDIRVLDAISNPLQALRISLGGTYHMQEKITYFCYEQGRREIYFI